MFFTLALASSTLGATWIVDDDGGPGVDFTDIPPAIAAASHGDLILVRNGYYGAFVLDKGLALVADTGHYPLLGYNGAAITNISKSLSATVSGFNMNTLSIHDCEGTVLVDRSFIGQSEGQAALRISHSDQVILCRVTAKAKKYKIGKGAELASSTIIASECWFQGADGADSSYYSNGYPGHPGVHAKDCTLFLQSSTAIGGNGGDGWWDDWKIFHGGDGAPGIRLDHSYLELFGLPSHLISGGYGGEPSNSFANYGEDANALLAYDSCVYYSGCQFKTHSLIYYPPPPFGGSNSTILEISPEVPVITLKGKGELDTEIEVTLDAPTHAGYLLYFSPSTAIHKMGKSVFTHLLLDPGLLVFVAGNKIPGSGQAAFRFHIPMVPWLQGAAFHFQAFVKTAVGKPYLSTSAGFVVR